MSANLFAGVDVRIIFRPESDAFGCFDLDGVRWIASKHGIAVECGSEFFLEFTTTHARRLGYGKWGIKNVRVDAIAQGKWRDIDIVAGLTAARCRQVFKVVSMPNEQHEDVDEEKVAKLCAADGMKPYYQGARTKLFDRVMQARGGVVPSQVCRAYTMLSMVGLIDLTLGPRGGFTCAGIQWTDAAMRKEIQLNPFARATAHDDETALECLALGFN